MANNNYPQITSVTSESLQAQIRTLLPSQEGFGTDLMAQNVIVPIIDLTSAAEGSSVPSYLQQALAFGSQTTFSANNTTATIANTAGFWLVEYQIASASGHIASVRISDGLSNKNLVVGAANVGTNIDISGQLIAFLRSGDSLVAFSNNGGSVCQGSARQIADVNGTLINPSGFTPQ